MLGLVLRNHTQKHWEGDVGVSGTELLFPGRRWWHGKSGKESHEHLLICVECQVFRWEWMIETCLYTVGTQKQGLCWRENCELQLSRAFYKPKWLSLFNTISFYFLAGKNKLYFDQLLFNILRSMSYNQLLPGCCLDGGPLTDRPYILATITFQTPSTWELLLKHLS